MDLIKKLLLLSSLFLAIDAWSEEVPIQCNFDQKLGSNIIDKLNAIREKTLNTCLDCKGISCVMKIWPSNQKGDAMVCKRFFCTPMKIKKSIISTGKLSFILMTLYLVFFLNCHQSHSKID